MEEVKTFAANLKHAIRNKETVTLGGGIFTGEELLPVVNALDGYLESVNLENSVHAWNISWFDRKSGDLENSTIEFSAERAVSAVVNCVSIYGDGKPVISSRFNENGMLCYLTVSDEHGKTYAEVELNLYVRSNENDDIKAIKHLLAAKSSEKLDAFLESRLS